MVGAEIQHFLSFANASDGGTSETVPPKYQIEGGHRSGFLGRAHQRHGAVELKKGQISVKVVLGRCRIEDEVETGGVF